MFTKIEIAKKIIKFLIKWSGKKLERNHKVLKLLKILRLGELKDTFDSIYVHALVEYAVDANPLELTLLFATKKVKQTFEKDLYKNQQEEFEKVLEQELHSNKKLELLTHIYKNAADKDREDQGKGT